MSGGLAHYNRRSMKSPHKLKRVIINADDFGFSPGVTDGILRAHRDGIVTSTTIAANMPAAADAVKGLSEAPGLGIGVHLNVSQGPPLSKEGMALAGADGVMNRTAIGVMLAVTCRPWLLRAVEAEFEAQILWLKNLGVTPTHLDSHRHIHCFTPIFSRVARLARRYHIPFVRWPGERLPGTGWARPPAKQRRISRALNVFAAANAVIGSDLRGTRGTWGVAHTGEINSAWLKQVARCAGSGVTEIMTHPGSGEDIIAATSRLRECRQVELAALCDPAVKEEFKRNGVGLIHYGLL